MAFSSVIGQKYARERLGTLFSGEPGHAYLITGPSGIGKTLIARETAKALLCSRPSSDGSCGVCPACRYVEAGSHPDFRELTLASGEKNIKVADVRSRICADVNIFPQISKRKVYLIDGDGLNEEGQNALLKTLEEPPEYAVFILTAVDAGILLDTIVSRSVVISLVPNSEEEILEILEKRLGLSGSDALFYARYSNGIPGHAISLASSPWFSDLRSETVSLLFKLPLEGRTFALTEGYSWFDANKDHIPEILLIIDLLLRDMALLITTRGKTSLLNSDKKDNMIHVLKQNKLTVSNIERAGNAVTHASSALSSNCSFESTVCQMLLSIQKELKNA